MKVGFKVQKRVCWSMHKKGKIGGLKFWSNRVKHITVI
jgi:hypothetical protein